MNLKLTTAAAAVLSPATTPLWGQEQQIAGAPEINMWIPI